jgi:1,4-dihydroxy-2-naphthoyl-CoA hydrolase
MFEHLLTALQAGETLAAEDVDLLSSDTFGVDTVGLVWDTIALDRITAHLDVAARHLQPHGLVHGGVWCSIVESTASIGGALHAAAAGQYVVGVSNSTDFLRGVREGRVDVVGTPIHVGRLQQLWLVELARGDGKLVARGQVRLHNLEMSTPSA